MNQADPLFQQLLEIARTPTVERIDIEGVYFDSRTQHQTPLQQTISIRQILREQISFPDDLAVKRLAIIGTIRPAPAPDAYIPDELNRQRQQAGLPPLPFRWICESTDSLPGGLAYNCVADGL